MTTSAGTAVGRPSAPDDGLASVIAFYRARIPQLMDQENIPRLSLAVVNGDHVIWQEAFGHFGLKVGGSDDDLREALASLLENGVPLLGASDHSVTHSLYIADPDGNEIELYIDVPGVDWRKDPSPAHVRGQAPGSPTEADFSRGPYPGRLEADAAKRPAGTRPCALPGWRLIARTTPELPRTGVPVR